MEKKKRESDNILNKTKQIKKTAFLKKSMWCVCVCVQGHVSFWSKLIKNVRGLCIKRNIEHGLLYLFQSLKTLKISVRTNDLLYLRHWVSALPYILRDHPISFQLLSALLPSCLSSIISHSNKHS